LNTNRLRKIAFAVAGCGIATYAGMDVVMKSLSLEIGSYNAMLWRSCVGIVIAGTLYFWRRPHWPSSTTLRLHVWRGFVTSVMAFLFFWGLKYLPVAEAIGLTFIAPLIALYLAAIVLKERIGKQAVAASIIGLFGASIVIAGRLSGDYSEDVSRGIAAIMTSAVLYAYNIILQRQQALVAKPFEIAFFQNCTVIVIFGSLAPFFAVVPSIGLLPNISAAAGLGVVSLLMMSWAYARAPAKVLIPVEYTAFVWAAILGWMVFDESVTTATVLGTALIVFGCVVSAWHKPERLNHVESTAA
jgi:S-adenosylmethionine uptake transporter|tara:strand:+ start:666 stop:1565 length:900 start_codon:yes stop_codon:yes gene_type:complete